MNINCDNKEHLSTYWNLDMPYKYSHKYELDAVGIPTDSLSLIHESTLYPGQEVNVKQAVRVIEQCRKETNTLPVLCWDQNYFPNINSWKEELSQALDPTSYVILESNDLPNWLHQWQSTYAGQEIPEKKYRFSYLSGLVRYHRLELANRIKQYVTKNDVVVINDYGHENYSNTVPKGCEDNRRDLPWASDSSFVDFSTSLNNAQQHINKTKIHPAYRAKLHLIGETSRPDEPSFITEKTWRPLLLGCLTLTWGPIGNIDYLTSAGIEILDIDKITDADKKLDAIVDMLKDNSVDDIYQKNKSMIEHNRELVSSHQFLMTQSEPARRKIMERL